jgi:hypothetical protein
MEKAVQRYISNWLLVLQKDRSDMLSKVTSGLRFYRPWKRSLEKERNALIDGVPWINFEARAYIEASLRPGDMVFEYGAGGSTVFYSRRAKRIVSVEHDLGWYNQVLEVLKQQRIANCECHFVPPELHEGSGPDCDGPATYQSDSGAYEGASFRKYAAAIESFPDEFFDFVSIDGRARPACILHSRSKVRQGGYLLLDNSDRLHYQKAKELLTGWTKHEFVGPGPYNAYFWETTVWRKTV